MNVSIFSRLLLGSAACLLLSGCFDRHTDTKSKDVEQASQNTQSHTHQHPERADTSSKYRKPGASVILENSQPFFLASPGVGNLELLVSSPASEGRIQIDISVGEGLELLGSQTHYEFALTQPLTQRQPYRLPIQISASGEGRFYINLHATVVSGDRRETRVISAAVQVGSVAARALKNQHKVSGDNQSSVIDMPAQETVKPSR